MFAPQRLTVDALTYTEYVIRKQFASDVVRAIAQRTCFELLFCFRFY